MKWQIQLLSLGGGFYNYRESHNNDGEFLTKDLKGLGFD